MLEGGSFPRRTLGEEIQRILDDLHTTDTTRRLREPATVPDEITIVEDETLARRNEWQTLSQRIHQRTQQEGYSGEDVTAGLAELLDRLAQYSEISAVGLTFNPYSRQRPLLQVWSLITGASTQVPFQRSNLPVNSFEHEVGNSLQVLSRPIEQEKNPSLEAFREKLYQDNKTARSITVALFRTPLSRI